MSFDLHTHTIYCDGKNTTEEMVQAALTKGLICLGFSGHGYAPYDTDACMTREGAAAYRAEVAALREKYDLHMKAERFVSDDAPPEKDMKFIKR